mmetsp:Transcript_25522/g.82233  ORF Transcript_25522/g.82233 Transcript_25522/m.82233 type:complete len:278 (+) Transcript_25522:514-1347(+)
MRAGLVQALGAGGLGRDLPAGADQRPDRPCAAGGGLPSGHGARQHHGRQQRDWGDSAGEGDRRDVSGSQGVFPLGLRADGGQAPCGRERHEDRPHVHLRPQAVRAQGRRRHLRAPAPARAPGADHQRRRPRARAALGHAAGAARSGPWRGLRRRGVGDGPRPRVGVAAVAAADGRHHAARAPRGAQRRPGAPIPWQRQPLVRIRRGREPPDGAQEHRRVQRQRLHQRLAGALLRATRHRPRRGAGAHVHPVRHRPLHDPGGGGLRCGPLRAARGATA